MSIQWWEKNIHDLPWLSMTFHDLLWPSMTFYGLLSPSNTSMTINHYARCQVKTLSYRVYSILSLCAISHYTCGRDKMIRKWEGTDVWLWLQEAPDRQVTDWTTYELPSHWTRGIFRSWVRWETRVTSTHILHNLEKLTLVWCQLILSVNYYSRTKPRLFIKVI